HAAAADAGGIAADGAVRQRNGPAGLVVHATAKDGRIAADGAVDHRECACGAVAHAAAAGEAAVALVQAARSGVAADGAVGQRGRASVDQAATTVDVDVTANGTVDHRGQSGGVHAAAFRGGAVADGAVGQRQRAGVVHATAIEGGVAAGDCQSGDG